MMLKNFLFYGFSTFINTWTAVDGAGHVFKIWGIVSLCLLATSIPMCEFSQTRHPYYRVADPRLADLFGKVNRRMMSNVHAKYRIFHAIA